MSQYDVMKQLLPPGQAFSSENEPFHKLLKQVSLVFDDSKALIEKLFKETPGKLDATLPAWCKFFQISYDQNNRKGLNQQIIARLTAQGGQSLEYLEAQLRAYLKADEQLSIEAYPEDLKIHAYGINKVKKLRSGLRCGGSLRTYKRNNEVINRCREIRHAEVEARYYE